MRRALGNSDTVCLTYATMLTYYKLKPPHSVILFMPPSTLLVHPNMTHMTFLVLGLLKFYVQFYVSQTLCVAWNVSLILVKMSCKIRIGTMLVQGPSISYDFFFFL